ncbi:cytochrome P450 81Q32-like [Euphorbia lathyris]|uniref:cytochrome P450 81Q32-like n=1 Tax=Euphorbia lathyris TaxID=212925 RepID=UPI00331348C3
MEHTFLYSILTFLFLFFAYKILLIRKKLPPSPIAFPILGHLHLLLLNPNRPLHRTFHNLSQKFGPIISLRLGFQQVVLVSSTSAAEECLTKNDICFANRPLLTVGKYFGYNYTSLTNAPYGEHWRNHRRLTSLQMLSSNQLNKYSGIRRDEIKTMLKKLYQVSSNGFGKVELKPLFLELTFNTVVQTVTGKRYGGEKAKQLKEIIEQVLKFAETSYPGDFLPFLKWVDLEGFVKKVKVIGKETDDLLQELVDEQRNDKKLQNTMIRHMLTLQESQPEYYTDDIIKGLILDMTFAATDTTAVTLEWAISNLLNHPQVLHKAKSEIDTKIGDQNLMDESDISKLPYLQNIISETLRLYPPAPLLLPHLSHNDCTIGPYKVPKYTMLLINAWAIQRDPQLWQDAHKFIPERFEQGGDGHQKYKMMPFGLGRRACPGSGLANRVLGLALGFVIQCFEWKRLSEEEDIDMTEGNGLTMPKAEPLVAMCKPRDIIHQVFRI